MSTDFEVRADGSIVFLVSPALLEQALAEREKQIGTVAMRDAMCAELVNLRKFARDVMDQLPGVKSLEEVAPLVRQLRLMPADEAVMIKMRYWKNRAMELAEERDIYRKRAEGLPPVERAKLFADPPPSSWQGRDPKAPAAQDDDVADHGMVPPVLPAAVKLPAPLIRLRPRAAAAAKTDPAVPTLAPKDEAKELDIRVLRLQLGISQDKLAKLLGDVNQSQVSVYERQPARCPQRVYDRVVQLCEQRVVENKDEGSPSENQQNSAPPPAILPSTNGSGVVGAGVTFF